LVSKPVFEAILLSTSIQSIELNQRPKMIAVIFTERQQDLETLNSFEGLTLEVDMLCETPRAQVPGGNGQEHSPGQDLIRSRSGFSPSNLASSDVLMAGQHLSGTH
jgi:hypothetical protein